MQHHPLFCSLKRPALCASTQLVLPQAACNIIMAAPLVGFSHLWQQEKFSDLQLALRVEHAGSTPGTLQTFPAHSIILSQSPTLEAQV